MHLGIDQHFRPIDLLLLFWCHRNMQLIEAQLDLEKQFCHGEDIMTQPRNVHGVESRSPYALSADEKRAWDQLDFFYRHGLGYAQEMAGRPQTLPAYMR